MDAPREPSVAACSTCGPAYADAPKPELPCAEANCSAEAAASRLGSPKGKLPSSRQLRAGHRLGVVAADRAPQVDLMQCWKDDGGIRRVGRSELATAWTTTRVL